VTGQIYTCPITGDVEVWLARQRPDGRFEVTCAFKPSVDAPATGSVDYVADAARSGGEIIVALPDGPFERTQAARARVAVKRELRQRRDPALEQRLSDERSAFDETADKLLARFRRLEKARKYDKADEVYTAYKAAERSSAARMHAVMILRGERTPEYFDQKSGEMRSMADLPEWQEARAAGQALLDELG
jgi:hypothetical protein